MPFTTIKDPSSSANANEAVVTHLDFHRLEIDFGSCIIDASVTLKVLKKRVAKEIVIDIHMLNIKNVNIWCDRKNERKATYTIRPFTSFGSALHINLMDLDNGNESDEISVLYVKIDYMTDPESAAICWMDPEQTSGKTCHFLFTQGQTVLNRAFFPCQDTPSVRVTYTANVLVPDHYTALMSATRKSPPEGEPFDAGKRLYRFEMAYSIPSYLVALAVGNLLCAPIGPRSLVWSEPVILEKAQKEFQGVTEKYLSVAEGLYGEYAWGETQDILICPFGFPFGGMENPLLTFLTPCLIVGDSSLTDTVAHEIMHSWFGNLVTNATWSDFWINEGFTMYGQRRVTSVVHGVAYASLEAMAGWENLQNDVKGFESSPELTRLRIPLEAGQDPEDTYSDVAYEKGYALICYLQSLVGDNKQETFDGWMKAYVQHFRFQSITAEQMLDHFFEYFSHALDREEIWNRRGLEIDRVWLYGEGMPAINPIDPSAAAPLTAPADMIFDLMVNPSLSFADKKEQLSRKDMHGWPTYQLTYFLDKCLKEDFSSNNDGQQMLDYVGRLYGLTESSNAEVGFRWSLLVIQNNLLDAVSQVERFLKSQGKQKYTVPIYRALIEGGTNDSQAKAVFSAFASRVFNDTRENLHVNVQKYVQKVLNER